MSKLNEHGAATGLLIIIAVLTLLLIGSCSFAIWAYAGRQDYKNNVDKKIAAARQDAETQTSAAKDKEFAEAYKNPLKTYNGPPTYGSISFQYPKTWSAYVDTNGGNPLDGYFQPDVVPGIESNMPYALRIEVTSDSYDQEMNQFSDSVANGTVKISAFRAAKVPSTLGSKVEGQITDNQAIKGTLVIFPLRDKAFKVWTESSQYINDFNNSVLPNLSFSP